jgi:NTE family protein
VTETKLKPLYLALSGGGTRAMAFHAGVLKFLAEHDSLSRVQAISSVSGGSLLTGLVFHVAGYAWPSDNAYLTDIFPRIRALLADPWVEYKIAPGRVFPALSALNKKAHWLAHNLLESRWGITGDWRDIPNKPRWTVNVTNAETGKRVTISGKYLDCYQLGKTPAGHLRLADILAASAAVPGVVGPWMFDVNHSEWKKPNRQVTRNPDLIDQFERLHMYDGGLYDNLGLEEFVNVGSGFKADYQSGLVIVSDAGKPIDQKFDKSVLNPLRAYDILAIPMDQTRALRVRDFLSHVRKNPGSGLHFRLGVSLSDMTSRSGNLSLPKSLSQFSWQSVETVQHISEIDTRLQGYESDEFDNIVAHGYQSALMSTFCSIDSSDSFPLKEGY